jgi:hypothetical protein
MSAEHDSAISKRIASEVATMEYVVTYTTIPVPEVFHHSAHAEGDVRSPYILMSKVAGAPLSSVWNDMDDDKRHVVLRQVIDILLELWSHRFKSRGALFKTTDDSDQRGKDAWYIESSSIFTDPSDTGSRHRLSTTSYPYAAGYWIAYANAKLLDISHSNFGSDTKPYLYAQAWFMRSLIPALFDPAMDAEGCPLSPGDFHSQNIMVDVDTDINHPKITSVIDWEFSGPDYVSSFAQYPLFIVDHPMWDEDHPLRERNVQDQATFDKLIREAERSNSRHSVGGQQLSRLISGSYVIYLFQQAMQFPAMYGSVYPLLFAQVFGDDEDETFSTDFYWALMEEGILKKDKEQFDKENRVWLEAREVVGEDEVSRDMNATEFRDMILKNRGKFEEGGSVFAWLASV